MISIAERLSSGSKDSITGESNVITDLGADSLDIAVEIMMDLEDALASSSKDNDSLKTIGDIVVFIEGKVAENGWIWLMRQVVITRPVWPPVTPLIRQITGRPLKRVKAASMALALIPRFGAFRRSSFHD